MYSVKSFAFLSIGLFNLVASQTIDPSTVPNNTKTTWCNDQKASCPLICDQINATALPEENSCDPTSLVYACVCSNGITPNTSEFSLTIPYFECTEYNNQCVNACNGDSNCAAACRQKNPCGAQDPKRVNLTTATSTAAATASNTGGAVASGTDLAGFGSSTTSSASSPQSGAMGPLVLSLGQTYGIGLLVASFFAGFAVIL